MRDSATHRLTSTAARLFQERGLSRVGINEIIREADVARMSLYNNFGSKGDLAIAVYSDLSNSRREAIDAVIGTADGPAAAILAIFDLASELAEKPSFRGCVFLNLVAQLEEDDHQLFELVHYHKSALRECFERLATELGHAEPEILGRQLLALWDGALADAFIEAETKPILAARAAAARLIGVDR